MTFHGKFRGDPHVLEHAHESPKVMLLPLVVLATGAVLAGYVAYEWFVGHGREEFWALSIFTLEDVIEEAHHVPAWVKYLPLAAGLSGIGLAYVAYLFAPGIPAAFTKGARPLYLFLLNKWYFDELYDRIFVRPAIYLGKGLWQTGDVTLIDGIGPNGVAAAAKNLAARVARLQSGYVYHYAFAMLIGVVFLVTWYLFSTAG
jgi:NADH-quinone oxidoreductase subunit L